MDERLEQALAAANLSATLQQQKENLKLRCKTYLWHSANGGLFQVTPALICFVDLLMRRGDTEAVLLDSRDNPIRIGDLAGFLDDVMACYYEVTNEFQNEFAKLRKARSAAAVIET